MKLSVGLLVMNAVFIVMSTARSAPPWVSGRPVQDRYLQNTDVADSLVYGHSEKRRNAYYENRLGQGCKDRDLQSAMYEANSVGIQELSPEMFRSLQGHSKKNFALYNSVRGQPHNPTTAYGQSVKAIVKTLPIGQGDCTVIQCLGNKHTILFDCGAKGGNHLYTNYIQNFLMSASSITVMISHGHADHFNRIPLVFDINNINGKKLFDKIKEVIVGGPVTDYNSKTIKKWLKSVENILTYMEDSKNIQEYNFCDDEDFVFEVLAGNGNADPNKKSALKNQRGIVMKMSCIPCEDQVLFAGDMEGKAAKDMASNFKKFLSATHYKMAHHGASNKANQKEWLEAIAPKVAIVSHRYKGRYGHPRCDAIVRLKQLNSLKEGNVQTFYCIGENHIERKEEGHFIYSTAPEKGKLCSFTLSFFMGDLKSTTLMSSLCGSPKLFKVSIPELQDPKDDLNEDD